MYLTTLLLLLFLFLIKKNIEGYSDRIELDLVNNYLPPSSIGIGKCSINIIEDYPLCMNGFTCENQLYPYDDNIGICNI